MTQTRPLYVMVSRTHTGIARLIRAVSRYPYNHVSLTLDPGLRRWYSFARYVEDAPLYSGFICESPERFCAHTGDAQVRIFRVDIPLSQVRELEALLPLAGDPGSGLIYNYFDAAACSLGCRVTIPNSYTCLSFACRILGREHRSIKALCSALEPHLIYEGSLAALVPQSDDRTDPYFSGLGLLRGTALSARQLGTLAHRTIAHGIEVYRDYFFRRTVH